MQFKAFLLKNLKSVYPKYIHLLSLPQFDKRMEFFFYFVHLTSNSKKQVQQN